MTTKALRGSTEERALFNPAFIAVLAFEFVTSYRQASNRPASLPLVYVALPLALHRRTRIELPSRSDALMQKWLSQNGQLAVALPRRVDGLAPFVSDGIVFGLRHGVLAAGQGGLVATKLQRRRRGTPETGDLSDCRRAARFVGRWFGKQGDPATLLALWGFRP